MNKYNLPYNPHNKEPIIFIPKKILRDIPVAFCWEDIDTIISATATAGNAERIAGRILLETNDWADIPIMRSKYPV